MRFVFAFLSALVLSTASTALAQAPTEADGVRFRGAIVAGAGAEFVSDSSASASGYLVGVEGRLGVQFNHLIGAYVQPALSFGELSAGAQRGLTGTTSLTALVDFTFLDSLFVAVGGGWGAFNNPNGPCLHLRAGGYPIVGRGADGIRRHALVIGLDARFVFFTSATLFGGGSSVSYDPRTQLMVTLGYEAF